MTNERKNVKIEGFEDKRSANGRNYTRFKTSIGWVSVFEADIIEALKKNNGKTLEVGVATDDEKGFVNIREFYGIVNENPVISGKDAEQIRGNLTPDISKSKNATMWASYAKDLIIAGKPVDEAIKIVKQLKEEFDK